MSSWGRFIWGDGTLYGATPGSTLVWGVEVDWAAVAFFRRAGTRRADETHRHHAGGR